jgi:hypothetical protein
MAMPPCVECGFDPRAEEPGRLPDRIRERADRLGARLLGADPAALRVRRAGTAWCALEYAGHVGDVLELFDRRVRRIRVEDGADLEVVDHNRRVAERRYRELDPALLARRVRAGAARLADTLAATPPGDWERAGRRAGEVRTIAEIAYRAVHEETHHLQDIDRLVGVPGASGGDWCST